MRGYALAGDIVIDDDLVGSPRKTGSVMNAA